MNKLFIITPIFPPKIRIVYFNFMVTLHAGDQSLVTYWWIFVQYLTYSDLFWLVLRDPEPELMLLFIICSLRSWIFASNRLYSKNTRPQTSILPISQYAAVECSHETFVCIIDNRLHRRIFVYKFFFQQNRFIPIYTRVVFSWYHFMANTFI